MNSVLPITFLGVPIEFLLFAGTLVAVAMSHHHTLRASLTGLSAIAIYKTVFTGFKT